MAAAVTYYITTTNPRITVPIAAYAMSRTFWREPKVYRNLFQPLKQATMQNGGTTGAVTGVIDVPVVAIPGTVYTSGANATSMSVVGAAPDNQTNTPHRCDWVPKSGYAFALKDGVTIPDPPVLNAPQACTFNAATTTDILTQATGTWWPDNGDIVTVGTAGNGLVTTALYTFVRLSSTTGKLLLNGSVVDINTANPTGVTMALVTASALPDAVADVFYIADPVLVSTGEPL